MPATPRERSLVSEDIVGTVYHSGIGETTIIKGNPGNTLTKDVTGNMGADNFFSSRKITRTGAILSGQRIYPPGTVYPNGATIGWNDVPCNIRAAWPEWFPNWGGNDAQSLVTAAARTNPFRPDVLLPVFLFELGDIPKMIRHAGRMLLIGAGMWRNRRRPLSGLPLAKEVAAANLALQFGWLPLIGDLVKLADFSSAVDRRKKELERLASGKGLKRRITLLQWESELKQNTFFYSNYATVISGVVTRRQRQKRWATVRWKPNSPAIPLPSSDEDVRKMLLGLTPGAITMNVWEALPWSWLVDYFTNIGEVLRANQGHMQARVVSCCVMSNTIDQFQYPGGFFGYPNGSLALSAGSYTNELKYRWVGIPPTSPSFKFPLLTGSQLSILGSLAIRRA